MLLGRHEILLALQHLQCPHHPKARIAGLYHIVYIAIASRRVGIREFFHVFRSLLGYELLALSSALSSLP